MKSKSYAKVNIFLKIVGIRDNYHLISSRFILVKNLFDTITFSKKEKRNSKFELIGNFGCQTKSNTIYKVYTKLLEETDSNKLKEFFEEYKIEVDKNIPEFAGLGGGSSNAATFLNMCNDIIGLNLSKEKLAKIGAKVGADIPFFVYNYNSANVEGIGEIVTKFDEKLLDIETITPKIESHTKDVYMRYRANYLKNMNIELADKLLKMRSKEILDNYTAYELNDLFQPSVDLNSKLEIYAKKDWYFSGSGSSFFKVVKWAEK